MSNQPLTLIHACYNSKCHMHQLKRKKGIQFLNCLLTGHPQIIPKNYYITFVVIFRFWPNTNNYDALFKAIPSALHSDISLVRESSSGTYLDYCEVSYKLYIHIGAPFIPQNLQPDRP